MSSLLSVCLSVMLWAS